MEGHWRLIEAIRAIDPTKAIAMDEHPRQDSRSLAELSPEELAAHRMEVQENRRKGGAKHSEINRLKRAARGL